VPTTLASYEEPSEKVFDQRAGQHHVHHGFDMSERLARIHAIPRRNGRSAKQPEALAGNP
jgi:hypothetical protein